MNSFVKTLESSDGKQEGNMKENNQDTRNEALQ
jgi:hypothetical protein